jgi:heterodisulfide reductase subunit C2
VMDTLRSMARVEGVRPAQPKVAAFYRSFLDLVHSGGRLHELGMTVVYKLRSRDLLGDMDLGVKMAVRGKLKPLPPRIKGRGHVQAIFRRVREAEQREEAAK